MNRLELINIKFMPCATLNMTNNLLKVTIRDKVALVEFSPPTKLVFLTMTLFI